MIGTQRSGSNLLRLILNHHPLIAAPHPPHLLKNFVPIIDRYGDLTKPSNFRKLYQDMVRFIELNPVSWGHGFKPDEPNLKDPGLISLFEWFYQEHAKMSGAELWCCKSLVNFQFFDILEGLAYPPFYIHIYRDGRDVALSFMNAPIGHKHPYVLAKQWVREQELSLDLLQKLPENRYCSVKYEELLVNPEVVVNRILKKLGLEFHEDQLEYYKDGESLATASAGIMWRNVSRPIITENQNKFIGEMEEQDLQIFETVGRVMLSRLGYKTLTEGNISLTEDMISSYKAQDAELMKQTLNKKPILVEQRRNQTKHLEISG